MKWTIFPRRYACRNGPASTKLVWLGYAGHMRGIAEQGGANYGNFYMQAAQNPKVNVPGREEPITLMEATTAAERAAVKSVIADQYMAQYRGMNPLLMNKYLTSR